MADVFSKKKRSWIMGRVKSENTRPEMRVRRRLHALGFRFRLHRKDLPGRPDLTLPKRRTVIFVHGCFWHSHPGCKHAALPASNRQYWERKIDRNVERDLENQKLLAEQGWRVLVLWECRIKTPEALDAELAPLLGG